MPEDEQGDRCMKNCSFQLQKLKRMQEIITIYTDSIELIEGLPLIKKDQDSIRED